METCRIENPIFWTIGMDIVLGNKWESATLVLNLDFNIKVNWSAAEPVMIIKEYPIDIVINPNEEFVICTWLLSPPGNKD